MHPRAVREWQRALGVIAVKNDRKFAREQQGAIERLDHLVDDTDLKVTYEGFTPPPARKADIKVKDVAELVAKLKNEAKVI